VDSAEIAVGRLHLRPFQPSDVESVYRACQDPEIQRWTSVPSPYRREHAVYYVSRMVPAAWANGSGAAFAVLDSISADLLAAVGLGRFDPATESATLGYWCAPWARGHGVTTEAAAAVCRWGFGALDLGLIEWAAEVGNLASRRVAEKVGFTVEGTLRLRLVHQGRRVDAWVGSLLPDEVVG
jgi:RimJ/RimL family protein N-acetyltransferase